MAISSQSNCGTPSNSRVSSKDPDSLNDRVSDPGGDNPDLDPTVVLVLISKITQIRLRSNKNSLFNGFYPYFINKTTEKLYKKEHDFF